MIGRVLPAAVVAAVAGSQALRVVPGPGPVSSCVTLPPALSWLGVHLDLVRENPACGSGMLDAAPAVTHASHLVVAVCVSTVIAAVLGLLSAAGLGLWARAMVRRARTWVSGRIRIPLLSLIGPLVLRQACLGSVWLPDLRGAVRRASLHHRGPPALVAG